MDSPKPAAPTQPLRLLALDAEDLALVSAHLQDAVVRVGDLAYLAKKKRFTAVASRFDWAAQSLGRLERCLAALHFETVRAVRYDGFARERSNGLLVLLALLLRAWRDRARGAHPTHIRGRRHDFAGCRLHRGAAWRPRPTLAHLIMPDA